MGFRVPRRGGVGIGAPLVPLAQPVSRLPQQLQPQTTTAATTKISHSHPTLLNPKLPSANHQQTRLFHFFTTTTTTTTTATNNTSSQLPPSPPSPYPHHHRHTPSLPRYLTRSLHTPRKPTTPPPTSRHSTTHRPFPRVYLPKTRTPTMDANATFSPTTLLTRNAAWASRVASENPSLFPSMASGQAPQILWIGCSDSRVPETTVLDLQPGEVFVHRNIANLIPAGDLSSLSVLQYAVEVLQVKHIIVAGHYGCGGVNAALENRKLGLIDAWLRGVREVRNKYKAELEKCGSEKERSDRLVELNVQEQVASLLKNANVLDAVEERGLEVHGWVFDIATGKCKSLEVECGKLMAEAFRLDQA